MWGLLIGFNVSGRVFVTKQKWLGWLGKGTSESKSWEDTGSCCCDLGGGMGSRSALLLLVPQSPF